MRRLQSFVSFSGLIAILLASCGPVESVSRADFESSACRFPVPVNVSSQYTVECGYLFVPEDRNRTDSPMIRLPVAIVRSDNPNPAPDPVIYLQGGWQFPTLEGLEYLVDKLGSLLEDRDLIFYDRRGVGYAEPSLDCPEMSDQHDQDVTNGVGRDELLRHTVQAAQACHDRLLREGIDLAAYSTLANAADVNDLRLALGYSQVNLFGSSYGTRLAMVIMRDYPKAVRSAILDSTYPLPNNAILEGPSNLERSLELVAERCAADAACNQAYPDLMTVFYDLVAQLDANPRGMMNGDAFISTIWGWLYSAEFIPWFPQTLYQFHNGNWASLPAQPYGGLGDPAHLSEGVALSVVCGEEAHFASPEEFEAVNADVNPRLVEFFSDSTFEICSFWGATPAAAVEQEPVVSDVPALLLQGDYDPATAPVEGQAAVRTLSKGYYFVFPGLTHNVMGAGLDGGICSKSIVTAFLADPDTIPNSSCLGNMQPFFMTEDF